MHHGKDESQSKKFISQEILRKITEVEESVREEGLGATGKFPEGKITQDDEGEIKIGVTVKDGKVILAFGKPVTWLGFSPQQARQLAELLRKRSHEVK